MLFATIVPNLHNAMCNVPPTGYLHTMMITDSHAFLTERGYHGSIPLNIHEVWSRPFWGGSSLKNKTPVDTLVIFLLLHKKVIRGQIK